MNLTGAVAFLNGTIKFLDSVMKFLGVTKSRPFWGTEVSRWKSCLIILRRYEVENENVHAYFVANMELIYHKRSL